jgi:hypothetical protein
MIVEPSLSVTIDTAKSERDGSLDDHIEIQIRMAAILNDERRGWAG